MSNATIGSLRVMLGLDTAQFRDGLAKAQKELRSAGARLQNIGASMAGVGAAFSAAVSAPIIAAGMAAVRGAEDQAQAMAQVRAGLESMGNVAGRTAEQLLKASDALEMRSLFDGDEILSKVTANLVTFGQISGDTFDRAQQAIIDMATRLRMDLQPATIMVGKALNDPKNGLAALGKTGALTKSWIKENEGLIANLVATGRTAEAQAIILGALEAQYRGSAKAAADTAPWRQAQVALGQVGDIVGEKLLPVIRQVSETVGRAFTAFTRLPSGMQTAAVLALALAAALGPVIVAAGAVVGSIGLLLPVLAGIPVVVLPIAAAVAAAVAAFFMFRDDVEPVIQRLWAALQKTLGPALASLFDTVVGLVKGLVGAWSGFFDGEAGRTLTKFAMVFAEVMGNVLIRQLTAAVRVIEGGLKAVGIAFSILGDLLTGDFSGAWNGVKALIVNAVQTIGNVIEAIFPGAIAWTRKLFEGVKTWLMEKLWGVLKWLAGKLQWAGDLFFKLYDRVVGHSYIPDMVDQIGDHIGRLQSVMVDPITRATEVSAQRFEKMGDDVRRVIEGLLTDRERLDMAFASDTAALDAARKKGDITQAEFDRYSQRNRDRYARGRAEIGSPLATGVSAGMSGFGDALGSATERLAEVSQRASASFGDTFKGAADVMQSAFDDARRSADDFAHRFADTMEAVLRGDIKGVLNDILSDVLRSSLLGIGRSIAGWGQQQGGWLGSVFKMLPGFATGGSIMPGGAGGIDSQVVAFRKSPSERVDIYDPAKRGGSAAAPYFDLRGALVTSDLLAQVNQMVAAGEGRAVRKSAEIGRRGIPGLQQRQTLLGTT